MEDPIVTVVVTAYSRKNYILEALKSVMEQTVQRDIFEILVIKNFDDFAIDSFAEKAGARSIVMKDEKLGRWIGRAATESRGRLIAFLDDDDRFVAEKLQRLISTFSDIPTLSFYQNRQSRMSESGGPVIRDSAAYPWGDTEVRNANPVVLNQRKDRGEKNFDALLGDGAGFNLSSVAVTKQFLISLPASLDEIWVSVSLFLFFLAYMSDPDIVVCRETLTEYREAPTAASRRSGGRLLAGWGRVLRLNHRRRNDIRVIQRVLQEKGMDFGMAFLDRAMRVADIIEIDGEKEPTRRRTLSSIAYLVAADGVMSLLRNPVIYVLGFSRLISLRLAAAAQHVLKAMD